MSRGRTRRWTAGGARHQGESPANLPFEEVAVKKIVLNDEAAQRLGLKFPPELVQAAKG
jgi:ABC-type uncharacterized transport system substrate-binding protein